ncbi:MAG: hypothetical protein HOP29_06870 [Phycisphaerales bacterium]|nr:hypothetical protein [Phycisphaerales bacterium]
MGKAKRNPTLIEAMGKRSSGVPEAGPRVPRWWNRPKGRSTDQPASVRDSVPVISGEPPVFDDSPVDAEESAAIVRVQGSRLILSFSSFSAGVAVALLIAVVFGVYVGGRSGGRNEGLREGFDAGRQSIEATALNDIEAARRSAPNGDVFGDLPSSPVDAARSSTKTDESAADKGSAAATGAFSVVKGHTYIVVQAFRSRDDADRAQTFLHDRGVETVILTSDSQATYPFHLVTQKGFNCDDAEQKHWCDEYHAKIKELGEEYVKAGGRYKLEGYQKKAIADHL